MRKVGIRALTALFCAALAVSAVVAAEPDDNTSPPAKSSWWPGNWFGGTPKAEEKKPAAKPDAAKDEPQINKTAEMQMREQNAYFRRLAVCDRLEQIAIQKNDQVLQRQVDQLKDQVFAVYMKRLNGPVGGAHFEAADGFTEVRGAKPYKPQSTWEVQP